MEPVRFYDETADFPDDWESIMEESLRSSPRSNVVVVQTPRDGENPYRGLLEKLMTKTQVRITRFDASGVVKDRKQFEYPADTIAEIHGMAQAAQRRRHDESMPPILLIVEAFEDGEWSPRAFYPVEGVHASQA